MSREQANQLLAEMKYGLSDPTESEIVHALVMTGDLEIQSCPISRTVKEEMK